MKQVLAVVLHQGNEAYRIEVRKRSAGFYGKWTCQICGMAGMTAGDFDDATEAFEKVKDLIALHRCPERSSSIN